MASQEPTRRNDRWLTPPVVCTFLVVATVLVLGLVAAVTYLTARGFDPQPVVQLTGTLVAALAGVGTFVQNLATRRTTTKVERNTGVLATNTGAIVEELDARLAQVGPPAPELAQDGLGPPEDYVVPIAGRHGAVDDLTRPHPLHCPPGPGRGTAPAAEGR